MYPKPKKSEKKKPKPIRKKSNKVAVRDKKMNEVKRQVRLERTEFGCEGTGVTNEKLEVSHTLSIRRREDLACDPNNMLLVTRDVHLKIESWDIVGLKCEDKIREYVLEHDEEYYKEMEHKQKRAYIIIEKLHRYTTNGLTFNHYKDCKAGLILIVDLENLSVLNLDGEVQKLSHKIST